MCIEIERKTGIPVVRAESLDIIGMQAGSPVVILIRFPAEGIVFILDTVSLKVWFMYKEDISTGNCYQKEQKARELAQSEFFPACPSAC